MSDVTVSVTLAASPSEVWAAIEPIERHVDWMADAESIRFDTNQTRGVGTTFRCLTRVGPIRVTDRMEITEWTPVSGDDGVGRMGVRHRGIVTGTGVFTIESDGDDTTRFTWSENLAFPWYVGGRLGARTVAVFVLGPLWRRNLARLRSQIDPSRPAT